MAARLIGLTVLLCAVLIIATSLQTDPAERNSTGNRLYAQGEYENALDAYQVAEVNASDSPEAYYDAASALAGIGRLSDAVASLEQALKTSNPSLAFRAYYNLGNILFEMALYNDAVEVYRQAIRLNPVDDNARHNYELALLRRIPTPTPTPQEQNTDPEEDQADSTPTPNPVGQDGPTATPTPPVESSPDANATPQQGISGEINADATASPTPSTGGPLSIEDIERQLDAIQENQQTLREYLQRAATPSRLNNRDW